MTHTTGHIMIEFSFDIARHYGFEYLWRVHRCDPSEMRNPNELLSFQGGLVDDETGMLGSILIQIEHIVDKPGFVRAILPKANGAEFVV